MKRMFYIPHDIILDKQLGSMRVQLFMNLTNRMDKDLRFSFTLKEFTDLSDVVSKNAKKDLKSKYIQFFSRMIEMGYFLEDDDAASWVSSKTKRINHIYSFSFNGEKLFAKEAYARIWVDEITAIELQEPYKKDKELPSSNLKANAFLLLAYIRLKSGFQDGCFTHYQKIIDNTGISRYYLKSSMELLSARNIIYYQYLYIPSVLKNGYKLPPTAFVNSKRRILISKNIYRYDLTYDYHTMYKQLQDRYLAYINSHLAP